MIERNGFSGKIRRAVIYVTVILLALACLIPLWNIVAISLSSSEAVTANAVGLMPVRFTVAAYKKIVEDAQFWKSFMTSVLRVIIGLAINMVLVVMMAYPLSKGSREFRGRNIYMNLMIFAMLFSGGMIPVYLVVKNLNLLNTIWALILPGAVPVFNVILVMSFFQGIPKSLEEAAIIDGASPMQVLTKIYIPCSKPSMATVALFSIVGHWNDFYSGLIYMTRVEKYPLMTYISSLSVSLQDIIRAGAGSDALRNAMEVSQLNLNAAKIVVSVIPLLIIYPLLQRYLIAGLVVGAVKE